MIRYYNLAAIVIITCLIFLVPKSFCAPEVVEKIVARVDRHIITETELEEAAEPSIDQIRQNVSPQDWDQRIQEVRSRILNQMINEYVIMRYARDNDITVSEAEIESTILELRQSAGITSDEEFLRQLAAEGITLDEFKDVLEKQTLVRRVMRSEVFSKVRVTESEIKQYYLDNGDLFKTVEKVRPAILLINSGSGNLFLKTAAEQKIIDLYDQLVKGADFSELVALHSDGPERDSGGDIGFLEKGKIQPAIENAAFKLGVGDYSRPLEIDNGWVIVKLLEKEEAGKKPLEICREEIEKTIHEQKALITEQEWFDKQRSRTFIEIRD